jgi:mono/diheme cytochrome c family protein
MTRKWIFAAMLIWACNAAHAQNGTYTARAELLYTTHCIACHNVKVHWRDRKDASDWATLNAEVYRWQKLQGLLWSDADVADVSRYLNARYYHYPENGK